MELLAAGINHTTADVTLRERLAFAAEHTPAALEALRKLPGVTEAVLLSTCNRMELYCLCESKPDLSAWLANWHGLPQEQINNAMYHYAEDDALRHMMQVAAGLDSRVLGEPQILGQMHKAYQVARESNSLESNLDQIFQYVFSVAKRVRTETDIGKNPVSVASAAVAFARHIFSDLEGSRVLLVGAGEMIALAARHLREQGVSRLVIANRTPANAAELAAEVSAELIPLTGLVAALVESDIVISCTGSPEVLISQPNVTRALRARRHQPLFMVDLAIPRDIAPQVGDLQDVYLYCLDQLHTVVDANLDGRHQAANDGRDMVEEALSEWRQRQREAEAVGLLKTYRQMVDTLSKHELERAQTALEQGQPAAEVLSRFQHNLVNKLLHHPSVALRKLAAEGRYKDLGIARELLLTDEAAQQLTDKDGGE